MLIELLWKYEYFVILRNMVQSAQNVYKNYLLYLR